MNELYFGNYVDKLYDMCAGSVDTEPSRGVFFPRYGTVKDVHYKNVLIDSNWEWIPQFLEYEIIPDAKGEE